MRCRGALIWFFLVLCGRWAAAADEGRLPLQECQLEHPVRLVSIAARCGTLRVPEDRQHPAAGSIALNVAVVPALNRRSEAAPLFVLAGGPGQSAVQLYVAFAGAFARINRNHAVVLLDQRGTGKSNPLSCDYPEDWRQPADPIPELRKATADCLAKLGQRVRFYTTSIAVSDLDAVREALGYPEIDLYGSSYGTRVAELYMRRYPAHTSYLLMFFREVHNSPFESVGIEDSDGMRCAAQRSRHHQGGQPQERSCVFISSRH